MREQFIERMNGSSFVDRVVLESGRLIYRARFESFEEVEAFFIDNMLGLDGFASKAIGNVLLFWEK